MNTKGKFIVVEGLEGAGKSTAMAIINEILTAEQVPHIATREPGGTQLGETIRTILKTSHEKELDARIELLLLYASRLQLINETIYPALKRGQWVIADRFELSTFAYQGGGRGLPQELIRTLSFYCLEGFQPDLILYLDVEPKLGFERVRKRGELDRIEQEPLVFFDAVATRYRELIQPMNNVVSINANQDLPDVVKSIRLALNNFLLKHVFPNTYPQNL